MRISLILLSVSEAKLIEILHLSTRINEGFQTSTEFFFRTVQKLKSFCYCFLTSDKQRQINLTIQRQQSASTKPHLQIQSDVPV